jgi:chemotaxis protein histidine kinase CheA
MPLETPNPHGANHANARPDNAPDSDLVARMQAAISDLSGNFLAWVRADMAALEERWNLIKTGNEGLPEAFAIMFDIAHNMKGQGSTFGYPLLSRIANSLCRYLEWAGETKRGDLDLLRLHLDCLGAIVEHEIKGDGGALGLKLAEGLENAAARSRDGSKPAR